MLRILILISLVDLGIGWNCRTGNGSIQNGGQTNCHLSECGHFDCREDQMTIDPCTCCHKCALAQGFDCGIQEIPNSPGKLNLEICKIGTFCVRDGTQNGEPERGKCTSLESLVDLECDNATTYNGCTIHSDQCLCQNIKLCPNFTAIFPFPNLQSCQERLTTILNYELDLHPTPADPQMCPSDSILVPGLSEANSLRFSTELSSLEHSGHHLHFHCQCDFTKCHLTCEPRDQSNVTYRSNTLSPGNPKIPGKCCPIYECLPSTPDGGDNFINCRDALCPHNEDEFACSSDSVILPSLFSHGHCCPIPQGCQCLKDLCQPAPICSDGQWPALIHLGNGIPGTCCDTFQCRDKEGLRENSKSCKSEGKVFETGARWEKDQCVSCFCRDGLTLCQAKNCSECHRLSSNDTCCPQCQPKKIECTSEEGKKFSPKDTWNEGDCVQCNCNVDGKVECMSQMCATPRGCPLDKIVKIAGVCCPVCGIDVADDVIGQNASLTTKSHDQRPNFHCHSDQLGLYFAPEQTWTEGCRRCYCMEGVTLCTLLSCPIPKCELPFYQPGDCCPSCPGQSKVSPYSNYTECKELVSPYRNLMTEANYVTSLGKRMIDVAALERPFSYDSWWIDGCINCICREGIVYCSISECEPTPCNFPQSPNGQSSCCHSCLDEFDHISHKGRNRVHSTGRNASCKSADGKVYTNHANWYQDPCNSCKCHHGKVKCYPTTCPKQYCDRPLLQKGKCCPLCLGNVGNIPTSIYDTDIPTTTSKSRMLPNDPEPNDKWKISLPGIVFFKRRAYFSYESLPFLLLLVLCTLLFVIIVYLLVYIFIKRHKLLAGYKGTHDSPPKSPKSADKYSESKRPKSRFSLTKLSPHNFLKKSLLLHSANSANFKGSKASVTEGTGRERYSALATTPNVTSSTHGHIDKQIDVYELNTNLEVSPRGSIHDLTLPDDAINTCSNIQIFSDVAGENYLKGSYDHQDEEMSGTLCDTTLSSADSGLTNSRNSSQSGSSKSSRSSFNKAYYCLSPKEYEGDVLVEKMV